MGLSIGGREVKCVVFGLDGTFPDIQLFLRSARDCGALLAVSAKDEMRDASLKHEDISLFLANWDGNAENLPAIHKSLGIDYQSMLFLDADPFERELVRGLFPEVIVPDLPFDPVNFQLPSPGVRFADLDGFLESLDMRAEIAPMDRAHVPQVVSFLEQNRQFHLAARRYTEADCESLRRNPAVLLLMVRLQDRVCDYGLIAILLLSLGEDEISIQDWVMRAQFVGRGIEEYLMNFAVEKARRRGCTRIAGEYARSSANGMVRELYARFGFTMFGDDPDHAFWLLPVMAYDAMPTFVRSSGS